MCDWKESPKHERNLRRISALIYNNMCVEERCQTRFCGVGDVLSLAASQLDEYFAGRRTMFDVPVRFVGTPFQKKVWQALTEIPFGETVSYRNLAERIGMPKAVRAVANANGANCLSIIVPCHRVIGSNSALTGYAGGLEAKDFLLKLETSD
ncbi:MAG: methylated-DNA--[protein]-cysteine S-methyltransferase [Bacteroidaceae bacterium]|nr:methylated-DNA--[protein]-cysteine S-methyltransferase [Bacteroidaceae bacterium]